jgi:hypothetical protein
VLGGFGWCPAPAFVQLLPNPAARTRNQAPRRQRFKSSDTPSPSNQPLLDPKVISHQVVVPGEDLRPIGLLGASASSCNGLCAPGVALAMHRGVSSWYDRNYAVAIASATNAAIAAVNSRLLFSQA